jgi:hypothetical protein
VINDGAFNGAKQLKTITVPASVEYIGATAFENCSENLKVIYQGTKAQWMETSKSDHPVQCVDGVLLGFGTCLGYLGSFKSEFDACLQVESVGGTTLGYTLIAVEVDGDGLGLFVDGYSVLHSFFLPL